MSAPSPPAYRKRFTFPQFSKIDVNGEKTIAIMNEMVEKNQLDKKIVEDLDKLLVKGVLISTTF